VPVTATIEQVIANVSRPAGCFLNAPHVHYGFSRLVISKVIGGTPQGTWPSPTARKDSPFKLHGCDHYICIKSELNNGLSPLPGFAGALTPLWDDGSSKTAHNASAFHLPGHQRLGVLWPLPHGELPDYQPSSVCAVYVRHQCLSSIMSRDKQ
jgi:hypothetical protein